MIHETENKCTRVRSIEGCVKEIKAMDPNTVISTWLLRKLVNDGEIPYRKAGNKFLISLDYVLAYFEEPFEEIIKN